MKKKHYNQYQPRHKCPFLNHSIYCTNKVKSEEQGKKPRTFCPYNKPKNCDLFRIWLAKHHLQKIEDEE